MVATSAALWLGLGTQADRNTEAKPEAPLPDAVKPADADVRWDDGMDELLIEVDEGLDQLDTQTRRLLDATAAVQGIRLHHAVTVEHVPTLISFVRESEGAAVVPSNSLNGFMTPDLVRHPILEPEIPISIGVVHSTERALSPAAEGLLQTIEEHWPDN